MTRPGDPKGYYARLGVASWATPQAIDAAFQARSHTLHPDRNAAPDAARRYQDVLAAYELLSDERRRRAYDADARALEEGGGKAGGGVEPAEEEIAVPWFRRSSVVSVIAAAAVLVVSGAVVVRVPSHISPSPARALTPPVPPRYEVRLVNASGVNLRMGPGMEHAPTARIARGEAVELLQAEVDGWAYVRLGDGRRGYVAARFLASP